MVRHFFLWVTRKYAHCNYALFTAPRLVIGAVYKHLAEVMKLLWTADLHLNTIHVMDLCRAIWMVATRDDTKGKIFNVVDDGDTTQGLISNLISEIFGISHDYYGQALSMMCKVSLFCLQYNFTHA